MTDGKEAKPADESPPAWLWATGAMGLAIAVIWYFSLRIAHGGEHMCMAEHGDLGSSFGPVSAVFSLAALLAALWSMELQRRGLRSQDQRLDDQQELLKSHGDEFRRSADAQHKLTVSQQSLAEAQIAANDLTKETIAAQKAVATAQERANKLSEEALQVQNVALTVSRSSSKNQEEMAIAQRMAASAGAINAMTFATATMLNFLTQHEGELDGVERPVMYAANLVELSQMLADIHSQAVRLKTPMPNPLTDRLVPEDEDTP